MTATVERLDVTSRDGTRLNVERQGAADAPIVLLAHGWTLSAGFYHRLVDELVPDFRVIAYDQRGHGGSDPAGSAGHTPAALADDLAAVLTAGIPAGRQAVLVGHSMGAMAIVALAGHDPDLLHDKAAAALLASTGMDQLLIRNRVVPIPLPVARLARPIIAATFLAPLGSGRNDRASRAMMRRVGLSRTATEADVAYCTGVVQACPAPTRRGFAQMLRDLDLTASVPALDIPTQVLVGTDDRLTPPWHAARLARALPRCSGVIHLPRTGHMTPLTSADVMASAVRTLAARHLRDAAPASAPDSAPAAALSTAPATTPATPAGTEED